MNLIPGERTGQLGEGVRHGAFERWERFDLSDPIHWRRPECWRCRRCHAFFYMPRGQEPTACPYVESGECE